jgi:hypothetical protein
MQKKKEILATNATNATNENTNEKATFYKIRVLSCHSWLINRERVGRVLKRPCGGKKRNRMKGSL